MRGLRTAPVMLKIFCGQLVSTGVQTHWCNTIWTWCTSSSLIRGAGVGFLEVLMVVWRFVQSGCGVFFSNLQ